MKTMNGIGAVRMSKKWRKNAWAAVLVGAVAMLGTETLGYVLKNIEVYNIGRRASMAMIYLALGGLAIATVMLWQVARARHTAFGNLRLLTVWLYLASATTALWFVQLVMVWAIARFTFLPPEAPALEAMKQVTTIGVGILVLLEMIWVVWFLGWLLTRPFTSRTTRAKESAR